MEQTLKDKLVNAGIDVDDALGRFMNNESLMIRLLKKFVNDPSYQQLVDAYHNKDGEAAFRASHTLKGVCGNLSITRLFELSSEQVELFRSGQFDEGFAMMDEVSAAYNQIIDVINTLD